jgi:hypothetical protein
LKSWLLLNYLLNLSIVSGLKKSSGFGWETWVLVISDPMNSGWIGINIAWNQDWCVSPDVKIWVGSGTAVSLSHSGAARVKSSPQILYKVVILSRYLNMKKLGTLVTSCVCCSFGATIFSYCGQINKIIINAIAVQGVFVPSA